MALEINAQFSKFVQFAEQQMRAGNETAIARAGGEVAGQGGLSSRSIVAAEGDKTAPFMGRSQENKDANNAVRDLFRNTIIAIFGGVANIPENVKAAMKLGDFGQGKPLTARRIIAVKAEVDKIAQPHVEFNRNVHASISAGHFERLPQNMQASLARLVDDLRAIFGEVAVPPGATISQIVSSANVAREIGDMRNAADSQLRDLTAEEITAAYAGKALMRLSANAVGEVILAKVMERAPEVQSTARSIGLQFDVRYPGLLAEISSCKNPIEIAEAIQRHEADIDAFVDVSVRSNAASKTVESKAQEKLASALGLPLRFVAAHVPTDKLREMAKDLTSDIVRGDAPGCREPGYDVEAAYAALVDEFAQKRIDACAAVDSLDLPEDVKNRWKAECTAYSDVPKLTPAQLFEVSKAVDARKIEGAFSKGLPPKIAVEMLNNVAKGIDAAIGRVTGNPRFLDGVGADDKMPIYGMLIFAAEAKNPKLAQAIQAARGAFFGPANEYCESKTFASAALFVKSLDINGGTKKKAPVTNETKYLALVDEDVQAALAESGMTDAKVCGDVKSALLKRARAVLANATGLGELAAFLGEVKAEAPALAKTLDALAKTRAAALSVAATTISVSAGIGKAYVLHNLAMDSISSGSGKLRFLYMDVMEKSQKGEPVDHAAAMRKASDIVTKFAMSKVAVLKAIDEAGFDPAERAAHKAMALRDASWTDPDIVTVAARLAGNATVKNAMRLLAGALKDEAVATLDDVQLRDAFLVFGKAYMTTLTTEFRTYADRWAGSSEVLHRLQRMVLQFLAKEQPGIAASLAKLGASGRLARLLALFSDSMNEVHRLKMDYMTLAQYNLMGAPAGEAIRSVMGNPNLVYDEADYRRCEADDVLYNMTNLFLGGITEGVPRKGAVEADKYIALQAKRGEMLMKYSAGLSQETVLLLGNLVNVLDWRGNAAERSEEILKNYVEDMKTWRDVAPGSADSAGLEGVLMRRMNEYLADVLAGTAKASFNTSTHPGLFQTFLDDLPRATYVFNGKKVLGDRLADRLPSFMDAIKDQAKRKVVSVMINQQIYGDFTASVGNRLPFSGWKNGMADEPVADIPGIERFASRDIVSMGGLQLFDTGPMEFAIEVSPDESTVTVRAKATYPIHADITLPNAIIGNCAVTQAFVIDFTGAEPAIRDFKIEQAIAA